MPRKVSRRVRATAAFITVVSILGAFVPAVGAADGLEVTTPFPAVAVAPGSKISFDLTITSTRNADVALALSGVPTGWTASLLGGGNIVDGVAVTPSTDGAVRLDVDVPADAAAGVTRLRVTATGGGAQDILPIAVRVDAEAAGDVGLTTSTPALTGASDASFSFDLQFTNDTPQDVTLSVAATGPPDWTVKAALTGETQAASTIVTAGATQNVTVTVDAAEGAAAGAYPIAVQATAGERTVSQDLSVEITGSYSLALSTPTDLLSASGSAGAATIVTFEITNTGTAPVTAATLTGSPPTGWEVAVDPESLASIDPQQTGSIKATITPSAEALAGDYLVSFSAGATESGAEDTVQIRFTVETSPLGALIGLGIIVLILAGLFYVFRTYGRR